MLFNIDGRKRMVTRTEWYERVNSAWPAEVPPLTADEAVKATRKLYRFVIHKQLTLPITVTSGNRYSYAHGGSLHVNWNSTHHGGGWKALIHDLSHTFHGWISGDKPHAKSHARLELRLTKEVVKRGWLTGSLKTPEKPATPEPDQKLMRHQRILRRMEIWKSKQQRAERALSKLARQARYYERTLSQSA